MLPCSSFSTEELDGLTLFLVTAVILGEEMTLHLSENIK